MNTIILFDGKLETSSPWSPQHTTDPGISYHSRVNDSQNRSETCFPNPSPGKTAWSTWVLLYPCCFLETALLHTNHSWRVLALSPCLWYLFLKIIHMYPDGKKMEQVFRMTLAYFWCPLRKKKRSHWNYTLHMEVFSGHLQLSGGGLIQVATWIDVLHKEETSMWIKNDNGKMAYDLEIYGIVSSIFLP